MCKCQKDLEILRKENSAGRKYLKILCPASKDIKVQSLKSFIRSFHLYTKKCEMLLLDKIIFLFVFI